jgi:hypothetical protein
VIAATPDTISVKRAASRETYERWLRDRELMERLEMHRHLAFARAQVRWELVVAATAL